jgi:hypothetical protein
MPITLLNKTKKTDFFALGLVDSMTGEWIGIRFSYQPDLNEKAGQKVSPFGALRWLKITFPTGLSTLKKRGKR